MTLTMTAAMARCYVCDAATTGLREAAGVPTCRACLVGRLDVPAEVVDAVLRSELPREPEPAPAAKVEAEAEPADAQDGDVLDVRGHRLYARRWYRDGACALCGEYGRTDNRGTGLYAHPTCWDKQLKDYNERMAVSNALTIYKAREKNKEVIK